MNELRSQRTKELLRDISLNNIAEACEIEKVTFVECDEIKNSYKREWVKAGLHSESRRKKVLNGNECQNIIERLKSDIGQVNKGLLEKIIENTENRNVGRVMLVHPDPRFNSEGEILDYEEMLYEAKEALVILDLKGNNIIIKESGIIKQTINIDEVRIKVINETKHSNNKIRGSIVEILTAIEIMTTIGVREVVLHCGYYGYICEYTIAAKILGIETKEIQHGALYDYEGIAYNFRYDLSEDPIRRILYPEKFILWGEYWNRQVSHHIISEAQSIRQRHIEKARQRRMGQKLESTLLMVNRVDNEYYMEDINKIRDEGEIGLIKIRLHPWIWRDEKNYIEELKNSVMNKGVRLVEEEVSLEKNLETAKKVYSMRSTIIFDCYALGIETVELGTEKDFEKLTFLDFRTKDVEYIFKGVV